MNYDIQVVGQGILYFVIVLLGIITAFPLGITVIDFDGQCCLYTEFNWVNSTYANVDLSHEALCLFPVYSAVFGCVFYALGVAVYHMYAAFHSVDPRIGFQMWVMPFLLVNTLVAILMFITSCLVSVGLGSTCDSILDGQKKGSKISSCSGATSYDWNARQGKSRTDYTYSHFYSFPKTTEIASWVAVIAWIAQIGLCVLRFVRNRNNRSKDMQAAYDEASEDGKTVRSESLTVN